MSRFARAEDIGVIDDGVRVYAAVLPDGPIVVLAGIAATVWRAALGADIAAVAAALAEEGVSEDGEIEADAALFTGALVEAGLLREDEDA